MRPNSLDNQASNSRLAYLDWMRGLAVLFMIETHVFDSFLDMQYHKSEWYWLSQYLGGMAAPMFLFLLGVSLALTLDRLRTRGATASAVATKVLRRGGWIFLLAYAFRIEQAAVWYPYSDWNQVFKVDILNCLAVTSLAVGWSAHAFRNRQHNALAMAVIGSAIVLVTPWVFLVLGGLPSWLLDYINGGGHPNYFMFFSWGAFGFAGASCGYLLMQARDRGEEQDCLIHMGAAGVLALGAAFVIHKHPGVVYGYNDYSLTSPDYFLVRLGYMLIFMYLSYCWSARRIAGRWSPFLAFGQTSLLIYWLHIEFVYGRLRPFKNSLSVGSTAAQLLWLVPLMLCISYAKLWLANHRRRMKEHRPPEVRQEAIAVAMKTH